jgi:hypothetical protein
MHASTLIDLSSLKELIILDITNIIMSDFDPKALLLCCTCSLGSLILIGSVTLFVYDIMALTQVSNETVQNRCEGSRLWLYLFLSMLLSGLVQYSGKKKEDNEEEEEEDPPNPKKVTRMAKM